MIKIFHNPRCGKSREALKILEASGEMIQIVEYLKTVPSREELAELIDLLGIRPEDLVRKNEAVYKEKYKGKTLSDKAWVDAMVKNPKLIERPIVVQGNQAVIGRPPERVKALLP